MRRYDRVVLACAKSLGLCCGLARRFHLCGLITLYLHAFEYLTLPYLTLHAHQCRHTIGMTRGLVTSETIGVDCVPAACGEALAWAARRLRACVRELGAGLQGWAGQRGMSVLGLQCWGSTCVVEGVSL